MRGSGGMWRRQIPTMRVNAEADKADKADSEAREGNVVMPGMAQMLQVPDVDRIRIGRSPPKAVGFGIRGLGTPVWRPRGENLSPLMSTRGTSRGMFRSEFLKNSKPKASRRERRASAEVSQPQGTWFSSARPS